MKDKDWKAKPESYRKTYVDQMIKDVDAHNDRMENSYAKTRENDIDIMTKDACKAFVGRVCFMFNKASAGFHWSYVLTQNVKSFFRSLKRGIDLKKGTYSTRQRLVNGKWEYIK